ncbi:MAG: PilZ domain-containing protein [Candidatus Eremiobacteraeota bacterium]|nr:PilZ domain-containing protein [Candidatus Eremiobacteraeota bacterium]
MLKGLFGGKSDKISPAKLPKLHSFVDVTVTGRPPVSVSVESNGPKNIVTGAVGVTTGSAVFTYSNAAGKFRFATRIVGVRGNLVVYEMPRRVDTLTANAGSQKRTSVRMDTIVPGMWRRAKNGVGAGEFVKGNVRDISRGGCSLIIDLELAKAAQVEIKLNLKAGAPPVVALGEVMRVEQIKSSGKVSHGLRFHGITQADDRAIMDFINRRQSDLRSRGLA